jgi:hypothetical protein
MVNPAGLKRLDLEHPGGRLVDELRQPLHPDRARRGTGS